MKPFKTVTFDYPLTHLSNLQNALDDASETLSLQATGIKVAEVDGRAAVIITQEQDERFLFVFGIKFAERRAGINKG